MGPNRLRPRGPMRNGHEAAVRICGKAGLDGLDVQQRRRGAAGGGRQTDGCQGLPDASIGSPDCVGWKREWDRVQKRSRRRRRRRLPRCHSMGHDAPSMVARNTIQAGPYSEASNASSHHGLILIERLISQLRTFALSTELLERTVAEFNKTWCVLMVQWCIPCVGADVQVSSHSHSQLRAEMGAAPEPMTGISLDALINLIREAGGGRGSKAATARQLMHQIIVPRTQHARCAYTKLLPDKSLGTPLLQLAFSWEMPFYLAVQCILQHLGLPTHLSMPSESNDVTDEFDDAASVSSTGSLAALETTFVFVDFLSINLWGSGLSTEDLAPLSDIVGTLDSRGQEGRSRAAMQQTSKGRVQPSFSQSGSPGPSSNSSFTSPNTLPTSPEPARRVAAARAATSGLSGRRASPEVYLFGPHRLDPKHFVTCIEEALGAELPVRALVLCLDPELNVLGQLVPMHAAWRAMRSRIPIQVRVGGCRLHR